MDRIISHSSAETREVGFELGKRLPLNSIVCFFGDLGAGKTTFIQGLISGVTGCQPDEVISPTFVYLNLYEGYRDRSTHAVVYHFDLYRLQGSQQFLSMGFEEYLEAGGICCIEWAERIVSLLPSGICRVTLDHRLLEQREIKIEWV